MERIAQALTDPPEIHGERNKKTAEKSGKFYNFSDAVKHYIKLRGLSQKELAEQSGLSETTISRIVRNSNDKGSTFALTANMVATIILALKVTLEEGQELFFCAFPEIIFWAAF